MAIKRISATNLLAKECIVSAVLQLIELKPLSSISITELCKRAGVSRMTFYRNYESIEDIFKKQLTEIFTQYKEDEKQHSEGGLFCDKQHLEHYFDYLYIHRAFLDGIVKCNLGIMFLDMLNAYILPKWGSVCDQYTLTAFSGALFNSFLLWSGNNYNDDKEYLIQNLVQIFQRK